MGAERVPAGQHSPVQRVAASASLDFAELGRRYLHGVRKSGIQGPFLDKLPLNFLYIGLIHLALPQAKIIHLRRNPLDTCLAIYKQHFEALYPFSYDLDELARYYIAYHKLMRHWHEAMPGVVLEVEYEALIDNPEAVSHTLFNHCKLDWHPGCLDVASQKRAVTTASAVQVRQPIYSTSRGRWRAYADQLAPLRTRLAQAGIV
jgi:Sulfotransferase family